MTVTTVLAFACRENEPGAAAAPPRTDLKAAIAPFDSVQVVAPIEGRVSEVRVTEGVAVRAGDVMVTLTNPVVARDLVYARSALTRLQTSGATGSQPVGMKKNRRAESPSLQMAEEIVAQKERKLERMQRLFRDRDISKQELENAEIELTAARRDLNAEKERRQPSGTTGSQPVVADLERAQADLAVAEHRHSLLQIKAPESGMVMRLRVKSGSDVYTRDAIAEIVDSASARVQASIAPELLRYVKAGQVVEVKLLTIPSRRFREPIARVIQPGADTGAAIIVNIPNHDRMLQPGTPAIITIP
ncbi:MAG TPA: efflux RND transporter periplasmic adaptor subunit [Thermoanaerobaculia bacterium]|nr:efflux RND transporter periplasmic adaptor subunit [Thermoanaerobaculia bacterium]